jgi:hypothetical protein
VKVLFHSHFVEAAAEGGTIKSARFASKGGPFDAEARVYVDATGDADLAASAGARVEVGRREDGLCQPMTLCFRVAGIDRGKLPRGRREMAEVLNDVYLAAKARGAVRNPREDVLVFETLRADVLHFNTTRVIAKSPLDAQSLSEAEFEGRRQVREMVELLRREAPGFAGAYLEKMAAQIGVRESRRVMAECVLTVDDVVSARKFPDAIACSSYPVDIHNPAGTGTVIREVPEGDWYEIPYRTIVPAGMSNLIMASRSISATHEAHSSLRVMPVVSAIGQAAGTAAAMAASGGVNPAVVDVVRLRAALREAGAFVGVAAG